MRDGYLPFLRLQSPKELTRSKTAEGYLEDLWATRGDAYFFESFAMAGPNLSYEGSSNTPLSPVGYEDGENYNFDLAHLLRCAGEVVIRKLLADLDRDIVLITEREQLAEAKAPCNCASTNCDLGPHGDVVCPPGYARVLKIWLQAVLNAHLLSAEVGCE